jgi:hypothetical protein
MTLDRKRLPVLASWLSANVVMLLGVVYVLFAHDDSGGQVPVTVAQPASVIGILTGEDPTMLTVAIIERPVLHQGREFVQPRAQRPPPPALPPYSLAGYLTIPGKAPIAIVRDAASGRTVRVKKGDQLDVWVVVKVASTAVTVEREGYRITITRQGSAPSQEAPDTTGTDPATGRPVPGGGNR